jgi:hypothetical protein
MTLIAPPVSCRAHMDAWRRQIGHRRALADARGPRPYAVIGYRVDGPLAEDRYIPLRRLMLTALFDQRLSDGTLATRLVGIGAVVGPDGLCFGGIRLSRFDKDLRLAPARGRVGARLDAADQEFFEYALALERFLERCSRHPYMPRARLPRLPSPEAGVVVDQNTLVDVTTLPKRQVIRLDDPERDLVGRNGTTTYDFVHTRFRLAH